MAAQFQPMKAEAAPLDKLATLKYPLYVAPKLDGFRAVVRNGQLLSKTLKPIPNAYTRQLFGRPELEGLDGELIVGDPYGPDVFKRTSSGVTTRSGEPQVTFHVFDRMNDSPNACWSARYHYACNMIAQAGSALVMPVQHDVVHDVEQLLRYEEHYITLGYEGVMLRAPAGPYKYGRSTLREGYLLKLKRFEDAEAVVLGVEEEMQNTNEAVRQADGSSKRSTVKAGLVGKNVLGALIVRGFNGRYKGTAFRVGSGFTASERAALWADAQGLVGKVITYKFFNVGSDAAPRFPTFKGFRSPLDMA